MRTTTTSSARPLCDCPHCGTPWRAYASLFQSSPQPMWVFDRETLRFLEVNEAAVRQYGYSRDEFLALTIMDIRPPEDAAWLRGALRRDHDEESFGTVSGRHLLRDGTQIEVAVRGHAVEWDGRPAWVVTVTDVSPIRAAERQSEALSRDLELERARLREVLERVPAPIAVLRGPDHVFDLANAACRELLGRDPVGMRARDAAPELAAQGVIELLDRVQSTGERLARQDARLVLGTAEAHDGSPEERFVSFSMEPLRGVGGDVEGLLVHGVDMTAQVRTRKQLERQEDALRMSEARFRFLVEGSEQVLFYVHDLDGRFEYVSPSAMSMLGRSPDELVGTHYARTLAAGPQAEEVERLTLAALDSGHAQPTYQAHTLHRDGRRLVVEVTEEPVVRDGRVVGLQGFARDITDRVAAETARRESEERLQAIVNTVTEGLLMLDAQGRFTFANPAAERILGVTGSELRGRTFDDPAWGITRSDGAPMPRNELPFVRVMSGEESVHDVEQAIRRPDGTFVILSANAAAMRDATGSVSGMIASVRDITERKRAEQDLAAMHARLLAVIDTSPLGIVLVDGARNVQVWNRAAERIFGWRASEVVGRPNPVRAPDGSPAAAAPSPGESLEGAEMQRLARDGRLLSLNTWTAQLHGHGDAAAGVLFVFADVSDRKQLEEQLRQAQKMEAVGRLAGGVAHDFNNVLTSILGYAELLLERLPDTGCDVHDDLVEIRNGAERARSLTQQLLAFSRKQIVQPRVLDPGEVARDMWRMLLHLLGGNIAVQLECEPDLSCVHVDRGQLEQVLLNLAVNARDAMPGGGTLRIAMRNAELKEQDARSLPGTRPGRYVAIDVSDTGTGIDPSVKPYIFEPFFTTKELGKGTGLGLATVYGVLAQNDGFILVDSEPGRGSTFRLFLPRATGTVTVQSSTVPAAETSGTETILVVEDEPGVRALAKRVLEARGYTVLDAEHGAAALQVVREFDGPIHLLLTDMVMPGMGGRELAQHLLEQRPDLRIIYMSGYTEEIISGDALSDDSRARRPAFLEKPFAPSGLVEAVRLALDPGTSPGPD